MKKKLKHALLALLPILGVTALFSTVFASSPDEVSNLFPDPVLAELVALNLNMGVNEVVTDEELSAVVVLNFDPAERVTDFTGLDLLENLEHLYLDHHGLTSLDPFIDLPSLKVLNVEGNEINDLTPLTGMTSLEVLMLGGNPIANVDALLSLPGLIGLSLFETHLTDLSSVATMTQLEALDVSALNIEISELNGLSALTNLRTLTINDIEFEDIDFLSHLTMLEGLRLFNNGYITDLTPLSNLTGLTQLEVANNRVGDIAVVGMLSNLEMLSLSGNDIEDVTPIGNLSHLEYVDLSGNRIMDVSALSGLNVFDLNVSGQDVLFLGVGMNVDIPVVVYDLNGQALPLTIVSGTGTYENGVVRWLEEDFSELVWSTTEPGFVFNGSLMYEVWENFEDDDSTWLDEEAFCPEDFDSGFDEVVWGEDEIHPCFDFGDEEDDRLWLDEAEECPDDFDWDGDEADNPCGDFGDEEEDDRLWLDEAEECPDDFDWDGDEADNPCGDFGDEEEDDRVWLDEEEECPDDFDWDGDEADNPCREIEEDDRLWLDDEEPIPGFDFGNNEEDGETEDEGANGGNEAGSDPSSDVDNGGSDAPPTTETPSGGTGIAGLPAAGAVVGSLTLGGAVVTLSGLAFASKKKGKRDK